MTKYKDQRVCVLVDVQNMYHSARNLHNNARVDFKQVLETVTAGRKLIRAIAYVIRSQSAEETSFFEALEKSGFELKMKDLQVFMGGSKKADWDIGMAMDAVKMADKLDVVILVTGDGDFVPLVSYLRENKGCLIEVAAFRESTSSRLVEAADDFIDLSSNAEFLMKRKRMPGAR